MPRKKPDPGLFTEFNGLWARGPADTIPHDHFADCLNVMGLDNTVQSRYGLSAYLGLTNVTRLALFKPNPPFSGTNVPRVLALTSAGSIYDCLISTTVPIYTNALMKDFGYVNFFGRGYISPSDGKVGLQNEYVKVYSGGGAAVANAAGAPPTAPLAIIGAPFVDGLIEVGTYLVSYAFETATGFVTQPASPFVGIDSFGAYKFTVTSLPVGPAGTVARWIIITQSSPLLSLGPLGGPYDVGKAAFLPLFFCQRVADNTTTAGVVLNFYDESLIDDASYLYTQLSTIPAGVGLIDYKGRMVSYGEYADPSLTRISEIGEPEAFSSTSGFLITDPTDSTGVRCATEFRNTLYLFKQSRGYMTEDNQQEASTWPVINFEKAVGTEHYGVAALLDAKGSSSDGFIMASLGALYYFNGVVVEPEISFKIRDLWLRINKEVFHLVQVSNDPTNKRLFILVPLDDSTKVSHIIYGDYRNGLSADSIKWYIWQYKTGPTSLLIYTDFTNNLPNLVTRIANEDAIRTLNETYPSDDENDAIDAYFVTAPFRYSEGISQYTAIKVRGFGPSNLEISLIGEDGDVVATTDGLELPVRPGREYVIFAELVSEQAQLKMRCNAVGEVLKINFVKVEGQALWDEWPN